jgi:hypothetical protein
MGLRRPSGPYRIATILRDNDWDVEVIDYVLNWEDEELHELVRRRVTTDTLFFGFSCFFFYWSAKMDRFVEWLKKEYPHIKTVIGGQSRLITTTKNMDYIVHGYGEMAILEVVKAIAGNSNVKLTLDPMFFGSKKVITANNAYPAFPMKSLRIKYEDRDDIQSWEWLTMEFARGCIFKCAYCNFPILGVKEDPNNLPANKMTLRTGVPRVSAGDPHAEDIKTDGIEVRGRSKQTKGKLARGPMY